MKITNAIILKSIVLVALGSAAACQTDTTVKNTAASAPSNNTRPETNTANKAATPEITTKETPKSSDVSLTTPTEAYKFAYAARQKKDVAGLKRALSKDALEFFEFITEPGKTIDDTLLEIMKTPQAATDESRNEKIKGDIATLEYPDANGKWKTMDFAKEGGEWKLSVPKPDSPGGKK